VDNVYNGPVPASGLKQPLPLAVTRLARARHRARPRLSVTSLKRRYSLADVRLAPLNRHRQLEGLRPKSANNGH
jgi:hypothetical protein